MTPLFGMAGWAEGYAFYGLLIGYGGLLLLGIFAVVAFFFRSRVAACGVLATAFLLTSMFMPWQAFSSVQSDDPDVHRWAAAERRFAVWWILVMVAATASTVRTFFPSKPGLVRRPWQLDVRPRGVSRGEPMDCYALSPGDGQSWLTPVQVVQRLRAAFAWVESDASEGILYASQVLKRMKQIRAPQPLIDHLEQRYDDSLAVGVSDEGPDSESRLGFVVMPEESIKIYTEPESLPLVKRCMAALGYQMVEL
jgi:hypothetical protein